MSKLSANMGNNAEKFIKNKFSLLDPPENRSGIYNKKNWDALSPYENKLVSIKSTSQPLKNGCIRGTHFSDYSPRLLTSEDYFLVLCHNNSGTENICIDKIELYNIPLDWHLSLFSKEASDEIQIIINEWKQTGKCLDRHNDKEWKEIQKYLKNKYYSPYLKISLKKDHKGQVRCQCGPSNEGFQYIRSVFKVNSLNNFRL